MKGMKWLHFLWVPLLFFLMSCGELVDLESIEDIRIVDSTIAEDFDIDTFDYSDIEIQLTKRNGEVLLVPLHEEMLNATDLSKLSVPGTHTIHITYLNHELSFVVTMKYTELKTKLLEIYETYEATSSNDLSYEEWVESIKGDDGLSIVDANIDEHGHLLLTLCNDSVIDAGLVMGQDGREVELQVTSTHLQWKYTDASEWINLITLSSLIGQTGLDGKEVTFRIDNGSVEWQYVGDTLWHALISIESLIGPRGIGISDVSINALGELLITYTDESTVNLGQIYIHYVVQFKDSHGFLLDTQHLIYGEDAVAPVPPIKNGYQFAGWDIAYTNVTTNLTVNATYSIETYTVTFDSEGGSTCSDLIDIPYGSTIELPLPIKEGYIFAGWYRSNLITASPFYDDASVESNLVLHARWDAKDYLVQFIDDDSSILSTQYIRHQESVVQPGDPIRLGYSFIGWYADQEQTILYDFTIHPMSDTLIYAKWELDVYEIEYIISAGVNAENPPLSYTVHSETFELLPATRFGYAFAGWYTDLTFTGNPLNEVVTGSTGHLILYPKWDLIEYTITYELNGGDHNGGNQTTISVLDDFYIVLHDGVRANYAFVGWYSDPLFESDAWEWLSCAIQQDVTLYAKWEIQVFDVIYHLDKGTNHPNNPTSFTFFSESLELFDPTRDGCNFMGWYTQGEMWHEEDESPGTPTSEIPSGTSGTLHLYAKWEVLTFNIYYMLNGGINHEQNLDTYHADLEHVYLWSPEREGYDFLGWYDNAVFENEPVSSFLESDLGIDITLYAKWEIITYGIYYYLDDGINDPLNPTSFTFFSETFELLDAIKFGYTFLGWYTNDEFEGNPVIEVTTGTDNFLMLYAKWELTYYDINYYLDDGINDPLNPTQYTTFDDIIRIYEVYRTGYTFLGWFDSYGEVVGYYGDWHFYSGLCQDINLYAHWELIDYNIDYILDGGTNSIDNLSTYHIEMNEIILYNPTREGYVFEGWYDNEHFEGVNISTWTVNAMTLEDITLYACWSVAP